MAGKDRSPNYPGATLEVAVRGVQALYKQESRTAVQVEIAVRALGYASVNGSSRVRVAALRQYGLIRSDHSGRVGLTDDGLTLCLRSPSADEFRDVIQRAALTPAVFRDIFEAKQGASDEALRHFLVIERDFSPDGAKRVVQIYRANIEFARLRAPVADAETDAPHEEIEEGRGIGVTSFSSTRSGRDAPGVRRSNEYRWPLPGGVVALVMFEGGPVTRRGLELLRQYLQLAEQALDVDPAVDGSRLRGAADASEVAISA